MQYLLRAAPDGIFGTYTRDALSTFQLHVGLNATGKLDADSATTLLAARTPDGYRDDGLPPSQLGLKFKIIIAVHPNRSEETVGTLVDATGKPVLRFPARLHGKVVPSAGPCPWPCFSSAPGMSQFAGDGDTPTGEYFADLNTPESDPAAYGPYNIVRIVAGRAGNGGFLVPALRDGILLHTGEWPGWAPGDAMPNSLGCIHTWPDAQHAVVAALAELGVVARVNTNGTVHPYPYAPQGLVSVFLSPAAASGVVT